MARLVYIPEFNADTWLHWSVRTQGSCLRDYRFEPPQEHRQYTTARIQDLLNLIDSHWELVEGAPAVSDKPYWREQISIKNEEAGLATIDQIDIRAGTQRLLNLFKGEVGQALQQDDLQYLIDVLKRWESNFACILQKSEFNHWDNSDASTHFGLHTGIGWEALMLELCRVSGQTKFIDTTRQSLDFSLIAMQLNLGISSRHNPFQPNETNLIKPDGVAIRRDNSFAVLENKGPQDDADIYDAMLQALCGALAVYAKREMIVAITKSQVEGARRVAFPMAHLPDGEPTMGLYVLVSRKDKDGVDRGVEMTPHVSSVAERFVKAWSPLKHVAFFFVDTSLDTTLSTIPVTHVIGQVD